MNQVHVGVRTTHPQPIQRHWRARTSASAVKKTSCGGVVVMEGQGMGGIDPLTSADGLRTTPPDTGEWTEPQRAEWIRRNSSYVYIKPHTPLSQIEKPHQVIMANEKFMPAGETHFPVPCTRWGDCRRTNTPRCDC